MSYAVKNTSTSVREGLEIAPQPLLPLLVQQQPVATLVQPLGQGQEPSASNCSQQKWIMPQQNMTVDAVMEGH